MKSKMDFVWMDFYFVSSCVAYIIYLSGGDKKKSRLLD